MFKKKFKPLLGIDISATSIKLIELSKSGSRYSLESLALEPLPENAISDKSIADTAAVGATIAKAVKKSRCRAKTAAAAVSGSSVITKVVPMPADLSDEDMESQIQLEADQYIPFPLEEVSIDFEVMGPTEGSEGQVDVLVAASKTENIDARVEALEAGGLEAKVIDIEAFALENTVGMMARELFGGGEGQIIAIADVGSAATNFTVLENLRTCYSREQAFGGNQLIESIQNQYGLSPSEARMAQRQGGLPDNYEPEVLQPFKASLAQEVNRAQQFFFSSGSIAHIDRLVLTGGCASIDGIGDVVETEIGVPTTVGNPFVSMRLSSNVSAKDLKNSAPAFMVSCGLALRSFD